jgi:hypothetical protein
MGQGLFNFENMSYTKVTEITHPKNAYMSICNMYNEINVWLDTICFC